MVASYPVKYCVTSVPHLQDSKSQVRESKAEHTEENLCVLSHRRRLPPYGPISRAGKNPTHFIPSICSLVHKSAHCTVQKHKPTRRIAAVELSISASSNRDNSKCQRWDLLLQGTALEVKQERLQRRDLRGASSCCSWWNEVLLPTKCSLCSAIQV